MIAYRARQAMSYGCALEVRTHTGREYAGRVLALTRDPGDARTPEQLAKQHGSPLIVTLDSGRQLRVEDIERAVVRVYPRNQEGST